MVEAFAAMSDISGDEQAEAVARGVPPSHFADFWSDGERYAPFRDAIRATYISGLDEHLTPDVIDDRAALKEMAIPALVIVGQPVKSEHHRLDW